MMAKFSVATHGGWRVFSRDFPVRAEFEALPRGTDLIVWLRDTLKDERFSGHAMIWEPI